MAHNRRTLPRGGYTLREVSDHVDAAEPPTDARSVHTLFAVLLNDVDRSDMSQELKQDVIEGLIQGWRYHAREHGDVDVRVDIHRHGLDTEVLDSADRE